MGKFKTEDGKIFDFESDAQKHANNLASKQASDRQQQAAMSQSYYQDRADKYNRIVKLFNAGDWNGVINEGVLATDTKDMSKTNEVDRMRSLAFLNRDGDYENAFYNANYNFNNSSATVIAGKQAWEKKNGRKMTEADMLQLHIKNIEKTIVELVVESWYPDDARNWIKTWEEKMKRRMSSEDEIRISGKSFYEEIIGIKPAHSSSGKGGGFFDKLFGKK